MFVCYTLSAPQFVIYQGKSKIYSSPYYEGAKKGEQFFIMELPQRQPVCGDIRIEFFTKPKMGVKKVAMLFNTADSVTRVQNQKKMVLVTHQFLTSIFQCSIIGERMTNYHSD